VNHRLLIPLLLAGTFTITSSCSNQSSNKNHGPIVLGDSATIVTETDPDKLVDQVTDLRPLSDEQAPQQDTSLTRDTTKTAPTDKPAEEQPTATTPPPPGNGLNIAFKEVSIFIPNIITRSYENKDLQNARSATYELQSGNLAGNQLRISGGSVQKVTQCYQTIIALKDGSKVLPLESLGTYSSPWESLRGNGSSYPIQGLAANQLKANNVTPAAIRNAVAQAGRRARMSRDELADWQDFARKVRNANTPPATVVLRNATWRIEGKDARGKNFSNEVRVDLPR
jgi:hypothetical protein